MGNIINSVQSKKTEPSLTSSINSRNKWLIISFWIAGIALGAWQAWEARHHMSADGMSYLDMADAYMQGDWKTAVNAYWSPLYSWLLGLALHFLQPSPYNEFTAVHFVNFLIFLFTFGCFHFFILQLADFHRSRPDKVSESRRVIFHEWAWIAIGYSLFLHSSLNMIGVWDESPDMLVAAFVYLASGIILHMRKGTVSYLTYALLGATLGFGYLAKAVMFPLSFVFLSLSVFPIGNLRKSLPRTVVALIFFLIIAGPFIIALSNAKGRLTFGDSGKYSYWFHVNGYSNYHWDGEPPGSGIPEHAPRKILDAPKIYEFGSPVGGTYPLWYDPSYWNDGLKTHFDINKQLQAIKKTAKQYYSMFYPANSILIFGSLILFLMGRRKWMVLTDIAEHWNLVIPAVAAFAMYSLVNVGPRYVAPFFTLLWLGIFSGIHMPYSEESKRLWRYMTLLIVFVMLIVAMRHLHARSSLIKIESPSSHVQWQVADQLNQIGLVPGDRVASIGMSHAHFWARLARVRIVAEISHQNANDFWMADKSVQSNALNAFSKAGAKAIVTNIKPDNGYPVGWQKISNTDYHVYMLKTSG